MKLKSILLLTAALGLFAASLHADLVLNGSFEDPALANGTSANGSGTSWTPTGTTAVLTNGNGNGTTTYGNQWELLGAGATTSQTLSGPVTLGVTYTLSLVAADIDQNNADQVTLSVAGVATASQSFAILRNQSPYGALPFETYSLNFTPTSTGSVTITLANTSGNGADIALDNVQVVPEPSTYALFAAGAGLLGIALRNRRRPNVFPILS